MHADRQRDVVHDVREFLVRVVSRVWRERVLLGAIVRTKRELQRSAPDVEQTALNVRLDHVLRDRGDVVHAQGHVVGAVLRNGRRVIHAAVLIEDRRGRWCICP